MAEIEIRVVPNPDNLNGFTLLGPSPDVCQQCAEDHHPDILHNQRSLYYKMWFLQKHGTYPTWRDAMSHCSDEAKAISTKALQDRGVDIDGY